MIDERERLERAFGLFEMEEPAIDRLRRRRARKARRQRIGVVFVVAAIVVGVASFLTTGRPLRTAVDTSTPTLDARIEVAHGVSFIKPVGWSYDAAYPEEIVVEREEAPRGSLRIGTDVAVPRCDRFREDVQPDHSSQVELVAWLTATFPVTSTAPITIGGIDGTVIDIAATEGAPPPGSCGGTLVVVEDWGDGSRSDHAWTLQPDHAARIIVVDHPNDEPGSGLVVIVDARPEKFDAILGDLQPVLDSIAFVPCHAREAQPCI